ncbi:hypothetical protein [Myxosarcina sp. GI1(2024)]
MYLQLRREISQLKQDRCFISNLAWTILVAIACSLTIAELQANSTSTSERDSNPALASTRVAVETNSFLR